MDPTRHTVVVGGGIAGLSVAWQLARRGERRVTLLEREPQPGTHSTARNAQIWLPTDDDETTGPLALRSAEAVTALLGAEDAWLRRSGAVVLPSDPSAAEGLVRGAARGGLRARPLAPDALLARSPILRDSPLLRGGPARGEPAYLVEGAGILDPHAMVTALARAAKAAGVRLELGAGARGLRIEAGAVRAVEREDGEALTCDEAVIAAGAWAGALGRTAGVEVPLVPLRRHLVVLEADPRRAGGTVWRFGPGEVYWRPESGGVLASPCDEEVFDPCLPAADPRALEALARALEPVAPALVDAPVRTKWACLRTYAHDRELVLGPDPRVEGLAWLAGLGGRGMTVGVGAAALCADAMDGAPREATDARVLALTRPDRAQPDALDG
ncbi:MAG TPA: FAD-dependent oxidoreductase [Sandaracinaceae bacterium LLY-WYZ-13_1]|nr:FAD-dependent oxidoreductase [Sandaracinaceae bacterium LLY-WYZ-13_1]